jgi:transposase InsO family protein
VSAEAASCVRALVHETHGLIGADALRHAVPGVSRRQAAALKRDVLTAMERVRIEHSDCVLVRQPGVVRGFDAMYIATTGGWRFLLVAADGATPFRTSIGVVERYDAASVAAVLERDFAQWGAPLVLRLDRAACHRAPEVADVLANWGVLALHGPAHYPRFYGQLERQNREHRAWLDALGTPSPDALPDAVERMCCTLNAAWPRRILGFRTAEDVWNDRKPNLADRGELRQEVHDCVAGLLRETGAEPLSRMDAERIAIEYALERRGLLSREVGGRC